MGTERTHWTCQQVCMCSAQSRGKETFWARSQTTLLHQCPDKAKQTLKHLASTQGPCSSSLLRSADRHKQQASWIQEWPFSTNVKHISQLTCQECGSCFKTQPERARSSQKRESPFRLHSSISPTDRQCVYGLARIPALGLQLKFRITSEVDGRDKATPPNMLFSVGICKVQLKERFLGQSL